MDFSKAAKSATVLCVTAGLAAGGSTTVNAADPQPSTPSAAAARQAAPPPTDTVPARLDAPAVNHHQRHGHGKKSF